MKTLWIKRFGMLVTLLAVIGAFAYALREKPVSVDTAVVAAAPMKVSLLQEGITRIRHVYAISSPIAGHLARPVLDVGDKVIANSTVIASIHPLDPPLIDKRMYNELLAAREATRAAITVATSELKRVETELGLAQKELARATRLAASGIIPESTLQKAANTVATLEAQVNSARSSVELRQAELASAEARLRQPTASDPISYCCIDLTAPVTGVVLDVLVTSEQPVVAGTRIADVGNPADLEVTIDLLSTDAVGLRPGTKASIVDWGGDHALEAVVRRIDPAAFTKVSALGIEEQRVNAILDLKKPDPQLGHNFRVYADIVLWEAPSVLQVPISALFRNGSQWSVFAEKQGRARMTAVDIGHMNDETAEIAKGLSAGETVVVHPSDMIEDGTLIEARKP